MTRWIKEPIQRPQRSYLRLTVGSFRRARTVYLIVLGEGVKPFWNGSDIRRVNTTTTVEFFHKAGAPVTWSPRLVFFLHGGLRSSKGRRLLSQYRFPMPTLKPSQRIRSLIRLYAQQGGISPPYCRINETATLCRRCTRKSLFPSAALRPGRSIAYKWAGFRLHLRAEVLQTEAGP